VSVVELDYAPYEYQAEFHDSGARYTVIVGGRRVGKSKMALLQLVRVCLEKPQQTVWWVAPTLAMAREVGFEEFRLYAEALGSAIEKVNEAVMRVRFVNGSVMYFKGADNERTLRGRGLNYVVMDEAAFIHDSIWTRAILPALADKKGRALLISTPNGRNWFYDLANYAANEQTKNWQAYHWPSFMNPLMNEEELEAIAASVSEMDYRQEFLAEFVTRAGMVYDDLSNENIVEAFRPSPYEYDIYLGIDFGYANPTAICFMAVSKADQMVTMFDEVYVSRTDIDEIEQLINQTLHYHGLFPADVKYIYTDPSGNALSEQLSQGQSPVDYLRMSPLQWRVTNKKSLIAPGVALVRSFVRASNGVRRFFMTENCVEGIRSMAGYAYATSERSGEVKEEPMKDGVHDHMCDAIRYFFVNCFDQSRYVAAAPEMYDYGANKTATKIVLKRCQGCRKQFTSRTPKTQPPFLCKDCETNL